MPFLKSAIAPFLSSGTKQKHKSADPDSRFSVNPLQRLHGNLRNRISGSAAFLFAAILASPVYASRSSMPWEAPLQKVLESIEGPVAKIVAVIIIIVTGLTLAFGDAGGGFRKLIQIVFGLSIAFAASSFFLSFFSFGGGILI